MRIAGPEGERPLELPRYRQGSHSRRYLLKQLRSEGYHAPGAFGEGLEVEEAD